MICLGVGKFIFDILYLEPVCGEPEIHCIIAQCQEGCFCGEGYIRNTEGMCIPERLCDLLEMSECQRQRVTSLERRLDLGMVGGFIPNCEENGDFSLVQCHGSTGYCWCANPDGSEILGSRIRGEPECDQHRKYLLHQIFLFLHTKMFPVFQTTIFVFCSSNFEVKHCKKKVTSGIKN